MTPRRRAQALVLVPFGTRAVAETAATQLRASDPASQVIVTDGEAGSYLDPRSGEVGYRVILRGEWVVEDTSDGHIVLRCKTDARPASREDGHG